MSIKQWYYDAGIEQPTEIGCRGSLRILTIDFRALR